MQKQAANVRAHNSHPQGTSFAREQSNISTAPWMAADERVSANKGAGARKVWHPPSTQHPAPSPSCALPLPLRPCLCSGSTGALAPVRNQRAACACACVCAFAAPLSRATPRPSANCYSVDTSAGTAWCVVFRCSAPERRGYLPCPVMLSLFLTHLLHPYPPPRRGRAQAQRRIVGSQIGGLMRLERAAVPAQVTTAKRMHHQAQRDTRPYAGYVHIDVGHGTLLV